MSVGVFATLFLFGAAAIALWVDARFPGIAPPNLQAAVFRTLIALGVSRLLFPSIWETALAQGPVLVAVFAVAFPWLIWLLLVAIWSIRQLQATMRRPY